MATAILTQERLRELLHYDPDTGAFTWRVDRHRVRAGDMAGAMHAKGYVCITIDRTMYLAHRLAWLYVTGAFPPPVLQIDHLNGERADNRWANLRLATQSLNSQNLRAGHIDGSSGGSLGVSYAPGSSSRNPWVAQIVLPIKRRLWLGSFPTRDAAEAAYIEAKRRFHDGGTL